MKIIVRMSTLDKHALSTGVNLSLDSFSSTNYNQRRDNKEQRSGARRVRRSGLTLKRCMSLHFSATFVSPIINVA